MDDPSPPLLHAIEPMRFEVPVRWRASVECRIEPDGITWDGVCLPFARINSVAYATRSHPVNLVQSQVSRRIRLEAGAGVIDVNLGHRPFGPRVDDAHRFAHDTIVATVHDAVEPRLRAEALRRMAAGEPVAIGPLTLTHAGLTHGDHHAIRPVAWERLPVALLEGTQVVVRATVGSAEQPWTLDQLTPNAVLLPELLEEAAQAFS